MRQLGARLPEPPRSQPTRETQARPEPPTTAQQDTNADVRSEARINSHHIDFSRERSFGLEEVPRQERAPWGLLEPEKEHRFPFVTLAVPGIAAILALGALLWSGSLRDRVRHQDSAMNALQAQNQKLADTLQEMSLEQKASNAISSSLGIPQTPERPQPTKGHQQTPAPTAQPASSTTPQNGQTQTVPPSARSSDVSAQSRLVEKKAGAPQQPVAEKTESAPSAQQKAALSVEESGRSKPVETAHAPEIVPPYPTNFKPLNPTSVAPSGASTQPASTYHAPFSVTAQNRAEVPAAVSPRSAVPSSRPPASTAALPTANHTTATADQYNAAGNGQYASSLAENIEAVQGLQRHSTVPLQEFHVHEGMLTKVTPALGLSVRHPDAGHGTYSLTVDGANGNYQLRGQVNNPLVFTDNTTHREYELVVLRIADRQVYGYVRAMR